MTFTESEVHHALYEDESGNEIGLDEVQLLDPVPVARTPVLQSLLGGPDLYRVYQAALILTAWANPHGLDKTEELVEKHICDEVELAPHRVEGYDNAYDEFAEAVHISGLSGSPAEVRKRLYGKLLGLYGDALFESKLKHALLQSGFAELAHGVKAAMYRSLTNGHPYLASQLLPVLAKWTPAEAWNLISQFPRTAQLKPDPTANLAEALGYIDTPESQQLLRELRAHRDPAVAEEARRSLARLSAL